MTLPSRRAVEAAADGGAVNALMREAIMNIYTTLRGVYAESSCSGETSEQYLKHAMELLEQLQSKTSQLKFNHEQCVCLVEGFQTAVQSAGNCVDQQIPVSTENWTFLVWLAMDVQRFIHECCKDDWIQAAGMLLSAFEHVASLICHLDLCIWSFSSRDGIILGTALREALLEISEAQDQRLIGLLKEVNAALNQKSISDPQEPNPISDKCMRYINLLEEVKQALKLESIYLPKKLKAALATNPFLYEPLLAELSFHDQVSLLSKVVQASLDLESTCNVSEELQLVTASLLGRLRMAVTNPIFHHSDVSELMTYIKVDRKNLKFGEEKLGFSAREPVLKVKCPWSFGAVKSFSLESGSEYEPEKDPEVSILATLSHPNVLRFLCYAKEHDRFHIVVELMDRDLDKLIKERSSKIDRTCKGPFSVFEAVDIILQIAEGMYYLYRKRVLHRDLKSSNILVACEKDVDVERVHVKVADFGLSKRKEMSMTCHHPSWNRGSNRWMAPELIRLRGYASTSSHNHNGKKEYEPYKSDVYSFGMVCYEILTGDYPFVKESLDVKAKEKALKGERPHIPSHCPPSLVSMIRKCWRHEPKERPTFAEICTELRIMKGSLLIGRSL